MHAKFATLRPLLFLLLAALMVGVLLWRAGRTRTAAIERIGFQAADEALSMPASAAPDPRFELPDAWLRAEAPRFTRSSPPAGLAAGAFAVASPDDDGTSLIWRGPGGGNRSLGDPVFAPADGLVLHAAADHGDGGTVVLLHREADGAFSRTVFSGLGETDVALGSLVPRGARIGSMGSAGGLRPAGVKVRRLAGFAGADPLAGAPLEPWIGQAPAEERDLAPSILALAREEGWTLLEIEGAERLLELNADE